MNLPKRNPEAADQSRRISGLKTRLWKELEEYRSDTVVQLAALTEIQAEIIQDLRLLAIYE